MILQQHHRQSSASIPSQPQLGTSGFRQPGAPSQVGGSGSSLLPQFDFSSIQVPSSTMPGRTLGQTNLSSARAPPQNPDDPAVIRDILLNDPEQMVQLEQNNPPLYEALKKGDFETFSKLIRELQAQRQEREKQRLRLLSAEPFDVEAQRLIGKI